MLKQLPIFNDRFWKVLKYIDHMTEITTLSDLKLDLNIGDFKDSELVEVINFLQKFNYDVHLIVSNDEVYIHPFEDKEGVQISLSFSEWIALQTHFPLFEEYSNYQFGQELMEKFSNLQALYPNYNIDEKLESDQDKLVVIQRFHQNQSTVIKSIEVAMGNHSQFVVNLTEGKSYSLYPYRLVYLEQKLTLIAENLKDKRLESIHVDEIENMNVSIVKKYIPNFSSMEIDDFIFALRAVNGDEERLILKVISQDKNINFTPPFQFMGTPFKTSNMNGEIIWAASVEVSEPLMEWLYQLKNNIEILDPTFLKEKYAKYCQSRDDSEKYRKVS